MLIPQLYGVVLVISDRKGLSCIAKYIGFMFVSVIEVEIAKAKPGFGFL